MADVEARLEEAALIARCQRGDAAAFDALVRTHAHRVFNLAYRMLGSQQDAEDAAQEAFLRALSAIRRFRRGAAFSTWLHRITFNICLDELKHRRNRPQPFTSLFTGQGEAHANPCPGFPELASAGQDPEEIVVRRAAQKEVQQALAALPADHRALVVMCDVEGFSYQEAAAALNTRVGTVKSRLHRARQRLRQLLAPQRVIPKDPP